MKAALARRDGFTLIETLAALAVGSVVIIATAALVRNVSLNFDRGARSVSETERIALAVERLAADFASARFVTRATPGGPVLAFSADRADGERPVRIMFIANAEVQSGRPGEEIVSLAVERNGETMRLVRRRAAWSGPRMRFEDVSFGDEVVLIDGRLDIGFLFARTAPEGGLVWTSDWVGEAALPRFVRLVLRDPGSGADLLGEADFAIRADAPAGCARNEVGIGCLTAALAERPSR